ncbi:MAG TPA: dihydrodipicolinate synthase family protein [Vicinamibacterales bacterium]
MRLTGLFAALVTPLSPQGTVEHDVLDRLCDFLLDRGVTGVCVGGATGEYPRFEMAERLDVLRHVARRLPQGTPLVVAIGASTVARTIELGKAAFDLGAAAVLLPMPWFFRYQQGDLAAFGAHVAAALEGPCLLYDLPDFTNGLDASTAIALLESEPHIVGIKDSSGNAANLSRFAEARGERDWTLLIGDDRLGLASIEAGWDGAVSGLACCCPELLVALHTTVRAGRLDEGRRCQALIDELIARIGRLPAPWGVRVVLRARGIDTGPLPLPLSPARVREIEAIDAWLPRWLETADIPNLLPVRG